MEEYEGLPFAQYTAIYLHASIMGAFSDPGLAECLFRIEGTALANEKMTAKAI
jgi:hypothetical protein